MFGVSISRLRSHGNRGRGGEIPKGTGESENFRLTQASWLECGPAEPAVDRVSIAYYSDLLCVWAYVAETRLDELRRRYAERVAIELRFVPVFGDVAEKIEKRWQDRGGVAGYAAHVRGVVAGFDGLELHPDTWTRTVPAGSWAAHLAVRAAGLLVDGGDVDAGPVVAFAGRSRLEELVHRLRIAFFREGRDVARTDVQLPLAEEVGFPAAALRARLEDGTALAALAADHEVAAKMGVTGSPTFVLNEGRQKLYGNVGYRILEANVKELLRVDRDSASWC
jgi:predicted DsbA family dithiol-disulfide isomerase